MRTSALCFPLTWVKTKTILFNIFCGILAIPLGICLAYAPAIIVTAVLYPIELYNNRVHDKACAQLTVIESKLTREFRSPNLEFEGVDDDLLNKYIRAKENCI